MSEQPKGRKINFEMLASISAIAIAFFSLVFSINETKNSQVHRKLSVKPILDLRYIWWGENDPNGSPVLYEMQLANYGFGPAILTEWDVTFKGKEIDSFRKLRDEISGTLAGMKCQCDSANYLGFNRNRYYSPNMEKKVLRFAGIVCDSSVSFIEIKKVFEEVNIRLTYQNIYEDDFETTLLK